MTKGTLIPSAQAGVAGALDPDQAGAGNYNSDWVSMAVFEKLAAIVMVGTLQTNGTVDAKLEQATDGAGTGAKDIAGKSITQLTQAGGDNNQQAVINLTADELDVNNQFTHARLSVTVATASCDIAGVVIGLNPRFGEASDNDVASVAEVIT